MKTSNEIALKQGEDMINDEIKIAEILDITRRKSVSVLDLNDVNFSTAPDTILENYKSRASILNIIQHSEQDVFNLMKTLKQKQGCRRRPDTTYAG